VTGVADVANRWTCRFNAACRSATKPSATWPHALAPKSPLFGGATMWLFGNFARASIIIQIRPCVLPPGMREVFERLRTVFECALIWSSTRQVPVFKASNCRKIGMVAVAAHLVFILDPVCNANMPTFSPASPNCSLGVEPTAIGAEHWLRPSS